MDDKPTVEVRYVETPREFIEFIREHGSAAEPADSESKRAKGVRAVVDGKRVVMYLKLADMIDSADSLGETTKKLLVTSTGKLIRDFSEAP